MIVWLASYPRSGNTFFRLLLHCSYGINTYSVYRDKVLHELGADEAVGQQPLPAPLDQLAKTPEIYFVKTHELPNDDNPAIYLVRDGRDALVSHAHYINSFHRAAGLAQKVRQSLGLDRLQATLKELITTEQHYGGWSRHVLSWRDRPGRTCIIRFEDLIEAPEVNLQRALQELSIDLKPAGGAAIPDFATLQEKWPQFFRKGKIGGWREVMPPKLHELFWQHHRPAMTAFGYKDEILPEQA